jgi:hypothetical protein
MEMASRAPFEGVWSLRAWVRRGVHLWSKVLQRLGRAPRPDPTTTPSGVGVPTEPAPAGSGVPTDVSVLAEAGPAQAAPPEAKPADAGPAQAAPPEAKPADAGPAQAAPPEAKPADAGLAEATVRDVAAYTEIVDATAALSLRPPGDGPLISVVIVTETWPGDLAAAVESVRAQSYGFWQLVVVDNRQPAAPPPQLAPGDDRVRVVSGAGLGFAEDPQRRAQVTDGSLVTYLDDADRLAPGWLAALVRAWMQSPGEDVLVGTCLAVTGPLPADPAGELQQLHAEGRARLRPAGSDGDLSGLAHARPLASARFDEDPGLVPSDHVAGLVTGTRVVRLPVLATLSDS